MPIIGIERSAELPHIGDIRKGAPKGERRPGADLDYLRFVSPYRNVQDQFEQVYGREPRFVRFWLAYSDPEKAFEYWLEEYSASGLARRCDGDLCRLHRLESGQMSREPIPCEAPACGCKPVGRLNVIIRELGRLATVTIHTSSWHDIRHIQGVIDAVVLETNAWGGDLRRIPWMLTRVNKAIGTPAESDGEAYRVRRKKSLLHLEVDPAWVQLRLASYHERAMIEAERGTLMLPAAPADRDEEQDEEPVDEDSGEVLGFEGLPCRQCGHPTNNDSDVCDVCAARREDEPDEAVEYVTAEEYELIEVQAELVGLSTEGFHAWLRENDHLEDPSNVRSIDAELMSTVMQVLRVITAEEAAAINVQARYEAVFDRIRTELKAGQDNEQVVRSIFSEADRTLTKDRATMIRAAAESRRKQLAEQTITYNL